MTEQISSSVTKQQEQASAESTSVSAGPDTAEGSSLLNSALSYAARGWPVCPLYEPLDDGKCSCGRPDCGSSGKHPRTRHGLKDATTDPACIRIWWTDWPDANIAIATGRDSGLVVLDVDRLEALHGWQSDTLTAHTGKGQHFYFSLTGVAAKNSVSKLAQGLDLRGDGGYVVAPPSRHASGVTYTWRDFGQDPQPAPAWLLEPNPIPEGERNDTLFKIASAMRGRGKDLHDILGELDLVNSIRCIPPLPDKEVYRIAESATQYAPDAVESTPPRSFVSLNELERLCRERPANYLIEGLLPADDVHVAVGDSGLGKTPWAYQLGLCVATGEPFLGYPTRQGRVLYIDLENGPDAVLSVARSLCGHLGITAFPDEFLVRGDEAIPVLAEVVAQYEPQLVIIDTLRPFQPTAEKSNDEMGILLNELRSVARSSHCTILVLHHVRKPGENGVPSLEDTPVSEWLLQAAGARALINQTNTRIAFDYQRNNPKREAALLMKFFIKMKGETGPIYLERVCDTEGEPAGYRRMLGSQLLGNEEQAAAYARLPEEFAFRDAEAAYGRASDPTRKFLLKCIDVGILEQPARGRYRKLIPIEEIEQVENGVCKAAPAPSSMTPLHGVEK